MIQPRNKQQEARNSRTLQRPKPRKTSLNRTKVRTPQKTFFVLFYCFNHIQCPTLQLSILFIAENLHPLKKKKEKREKKVQSFWRYSVLCKVQQPEQPSKHRNVQGLEGDSTCGLNLTLPHFRSNATLPCLHKRRTLHNQYDETQRNPLQSTDTTREPKGVGCGRRRPRWQGTFSAAWVRRSFHWSDRQEEEEEEGSQTPQ